MRGYAKSIEGARRRRASARVATEDWQKVEANATTFDPLFLNGLLAWLDDAKLTSPEESVAQLEAVIEVQEDFRRNPKAYGRGDLEPFADPLLTEVKRMRAALRRAVAGGKPIARMARARVRRAAKRAALPPDVISAFGHACENPSSAAKTPRQGSRHCATRNRAKSPASSATAAEAHGRKLRQADSEAKR